MQFDLDAIPRGSKRSLLLSGPVRWQVVIVRGRKPGKLMLAFGGVHGDEYEGPMAVHQIFKRLNPREMSGDFIGVPICNPLAFAARQRTTPQDGKNLARCFPGKSHGTLTDRMAHVLHHQFIARCNFLIDMHSGGSRMTMATLSGYIWGDPVTDKIQLAASLRFGAPLLWASPYIPGRTLSSAYDLGIPGIYTETAGQNGCQGSDVDLYANGVINVMVMLGILPAKYGTRVVRPKLVIKDYAGHGNIDTSIKAKHNGLFVGRCPILARVRRGDLIGELFSPDGRLLQAFRANRSGRLVLTRHASPITRGDLVFQIT